MRSQPNLIIFCLAAVSLLVMCLVLSPNPAFTFVVCFIISFIPARWLIGLIDFKGHSGAADPGAGEVLSDKAPLPQGQSNPSLIARAVLQGIGAGGALYLVVALAR